MKKYIAILFLISIGSSAAFADAARLSLAGGGNYTLNTNGKLGFAAGGFLNFTPFFEIGALYLHRHFSIADAGDLSADTNTLHVPVMARFGKGSITGGVGAFYETNGNNYGLTVGPRFGGALKGLFIDVRFNYGFKDGNSKDVMGLLGFYF